jgi:hypothetical protein
MLRRHVPFALILSAAACAGASSTTTPADSALLEVNPGVVISADATDTGDHYTIVGRPFTRDNALNVTVQYGGGCARHVFTLYASHVFMESHPVQSPIAIRHRGNGDACKALLTRDLVFDLTALRDAWRRAYGGPNGTIILRLRGYAEGISYAF